jgi:hypothetical protein
MSVALEARMASLEGSYHQISDRLNSIDRRLDGFEQKVEARFNAVESRIDSLSGGTDSKFSAMDSKIDRLTWRMTALLLGSWVTLMSAILLHR